MVDAPTTELTLATARFCRELRERGIPVTVAESLAAVEALGHLDLSDRREVYLGLRSLLTATVRDFPTFHEAFPSFWDRVGGRQSPPEREIPGPTQPRPTKPELPSRRPHLTLDRWLRQGDGSATGAEDAPIPAPSSRESLSEKDFGAFTGDELDDVFRVVRRLARRMSRRRGRRWRVDPRGTRLHLRRTARRSLSTGGAAPELIYRSRMPRPIRVAALCDVSGSMDLYSRFLLQFLYALRHSFRRIETFVFATRLSRVTTHLGSGPYRDVLPRLGEAAHDFSGGTRIGESLDAFLREWPGLLNRHTTVLILSDGWDTGEPEQLARALEEIGDRAARIFWLNPLAGSDGYRPATRGMRVATTRVDRILPLHNLRSLKALAGHLEAR